MEREREREGEGEREGERERERESHNKSNYCSGSTGTCICSTCISSLTEKRIASVLGSEACQVASPQGIKG